MQHFAHGFDVREGRQTAPVYATIEGVPRRYAPPNSWLTRGGEWPTGPFRPNAPDYAVAVACLVQTCDMAILQTGESLRGVARLAGIDAGSLSRMMNGQTVPDMGTVVALETALNTDLWPTRLSRRAAGQ